jgi:hypothetical protein
MCEQKIQLPGVLNLLHPTKFGRVFLLHYRAEHSRNRHGLWSQLDRTGAVKNGRWTMDIDE